MACATPLAWYDNLPLLSFALLRGRCRSLSDGDSLAVPARRGHDGAAVAALRARFGVTWDAAVASFFCAALVAVSATDFERRIIPNRIVLPADGRRARGEHAPPPVGGVGGSRGLGAALFLLLAALAYPGGMGMGDVKLALLLGVALGRTVPVALMVGMISALVPSVVLFARHGSAARKMKIPFGPFLAFGGWSPSSRGRAPRRLPGAALMRAGMDFDNQPDSARRRRRSGGRLRGRESRGHGELVSEVIGESGLLRPRSSTRCAGGGRRLVLAGADRRGFASALGVAGRSPSSTTCRSSTSPSPASTPRPSKSIALPVLERVCAIPFAGDGATLKVAITDPQDVPGARRAAARDAPAGRVLRRGEERRPHRAAPPLARGRGA